MAGATRAAVFAQPRWLRALSVEPRLPAGATVVHTGCGTSFHVAQTGGTAVQALDAVLAPPEGDILVCVSHEGETELTLEAARAFAGEVWLVTGTAESSLADVADRTIVCTPQLERSWCHTASYTCAVAALAALHGRDVAGLADAVDHALAADVAAPTTGRVLVIGAGRDWPTAQEAALKLREGAWLDATALHTEQLLHGHLAAVDESVCAYVLAGAGRAAARSARAVDALRTLGCEVQLLPTRHPVLDIVFFQLLTLAAAQDRAIDPDSIRRSAGSVWAEAAGSAYTVVV